MQARDTYLRSVQPPQFDPRQRGRDRAAYCNPKRIDIERMDGFGTRVIRKRHRQVNRRVHLQ